MKRIEVADFAYVTAPVRGKNSNPPHAIVVKRTKGDSVEPRVSILLLNYNSSDFIDLVIESLKAVKNLDYANYELILVDNGSSDGSFETIKDFIKRINLNSKFVRLERNLGFTGETMLLMLQETNVPNMWSS